MNSISLFLLLFFLIPFASLSQNENEQICLWNYNDDSICNVESSFIIVLKYNTCLDCVKAIVDSINKKYFEYRVLFTANASIDVLGQLVLHNKLSTCLSNNAQYSVWLNNNLKSMLNQKEQDDNPSIILIDRIGRASFFPLSLIKKSD